MKRVIAGAFAGVVLFSGAAFAKEATTTLKVSGWHCGGCAGKTAKALKGIEGVKEANSDAEKKTVTVTFDDAKTNVGAFETAIAKLNYKVEK